MKRLVLTALAMILAGTAAFAQEQATFEITGTPIPPRLLQENYGSVPKGIEAYDLSICNVTDTKQSIISSRIYQALSSANAGLQPMGRQIMLAAILRNQNRSAINILNIVLNSTTGVLSVLNSSKYKLPTGLITTAALGSLAGQQLITSLRPLLSADQLEKFDNQVLELALVLDSGSCVERTVFVSSPDPKAKSQRLSFHIH